MKTLKSIPLFIILLATVLNAKNITLDDFVRPIPSTKSINQSNVVYAKCLEDGNCESAENIMMILIKHKILYPEADYDMLLNPLEKIGDVTKDMRIKTIAATTYLVLVADLNLTIDTDYLYTQDVDRFYAFVHQQMPKMMLASLYHQSFEK